MAKLARDGVEAHRRTAVQRLEPGGTIGVAEESMPDLTALPAGAQGDPVQQSSGLLEHPFLPARERWEEQAAPQFKAWPKDPDPQNLLELRPERDHTP